MTRLLVDSGHNVRALSRSSSNESRIRAAGAEPVSANLFDMSSLRAAMNRCDAVLHLATKIPPPNEATRPGAWRENDRIRIEGTMNLVDAAIESGVSTFIYPSIVFFYPDSGADWLEAGTAPDVSPVLRSSLTAEKEVDRFSKTGNRGIVLRMGAFYGPTSGSTRNLLRIAKYGIALIFGPAAAYQPLIWIDDAALAVIDALTKAKSGIYDIVDDEPLQRRELALALAQAVGRRWLLRPPTFFLRLLGGKNAMFLARSQRVSNRKFKNETGWAPMVPSAREGFRLSAIPP